MERLHAKPNTDSRELPEPDLTSSLRNPTADLGGVSSHCLPQFLPFVKFSTEVVRLALQKLM